jgi:predicted TIM-barrel fold metal-dependent hydrolase
LLSEIGEQAEQRDAAPREGHYAAASDRATRLVDGPVVDTETHVFMRAWPVDTSTNGVTAVEPYSRTEHSGDLLVAEMDRAGVDLAILIGYDGYDFVQFMERFGSDPGDFMGGRAYTRGWAARHPDRLKYVTTLRAPHSWPALELVQQELAAGAIGVKIFPAYLQMRPDEPPIRAVFDLLDESGAGAIFGLEDSVPPDAPHPIESYEAVARLAQDHPDVPIQFNHGGNALPGTDELRALAEVVAAHESILVSTSVLGGVLMDWADEWRYPFATYLRHLAAFAEAIPSSQLAWATDWPWFEGWVKYPQLLQTIVDNATFFGDDELRRYVGGNALRHWGLRSG